ncbi:hypothetical protein BLOT_013177 [Blomia tropicalis]|nr:hypothetical protein BLOT_013177 [Blomia tropicalis]
MIITKCYDDDDEAALSCGIMNDTIDSIEIIDNEQHIDSIETTGYEQNYQLQKNKLTFAENGPI